MDFVPNHVHRDHPWFQEARGNKRSRYRNWFYWRRNGDYLKFLHFPELPKLNLEHPEAREQIILAAQHWLDRGVAGLRLDHAMGPSLGFWREFRRRLKAHSPDAALIGEVAFWGIEPRHLPTLRLPHKRFYLAAQQQGFDTLAPTMAEYAEVFDGVLDFFISSRCSKGLPTVKRRFRVGANSEAAGPPLCGLSEKLPPAVLPGQS